MEDEIQDKLEEIYNFRIDVKFKDFRQYEVYARIDNEKAFWEFDESGKSNGIDITNPGNI